jgi:hypothetical protein
MMAMLDSRCWMLDEGTQKKHPESSIKQPASNQRTVFATASTPNNQGVPKWQK